MAKQYAEPAAYEVKLEKVMARLGVEKYDYDWSRFECWVSFAYKGQQYRFCHSVENAKEHGVNIRYGSDAFAQLVLSLEDLARMVERGIYDLSTWVAGMKYLPAAATLKPCFAGLGFVKMPEGENPCHGCEERWVIAGRSCHRVCKRWLNRKREIDAENEARRAAQKARNDVIGFAVDSARQTIRQQNHSRKL